MNTTNLIGKPFYKDNAIIEIKLLRRCFLTKKVMLDCSITT